MFGTVHRPHSCVWYSTQASFSFPPKEYSAQIRNESFVQIEPQRPASLPHIRQAVRRRRIDSKPAPNLAAGALAAAAGGEDRIVAVSSPSRRIRQGPATYGGRKGRLDLAMAAPAANAAPDWRQVFNASKASIFFVEFQPKPGEKVKESILEIATKAGSKEGDALTQACDAPSHCATGFASAVVEEGQILIATTAHIVEHMYRSPAQPVHKATLRKLYTSTSTAATLRRTASAEGRGERKMEPTSRR